MESNDASGFTCDEQQPSETASTSAPTQHDMNPSGSKSPKSSTAGCRSPGIAHASSAAQLKMSPSGSKTPESTTGCRSPGSPGSPPVGEDSCPICLGPFSDKCAAGSCLHNFCLVCLKEWSKQKPVCPLCKQPFNKILYDIKSEADYKEWNVPLYNRELSDIGLSHFRGFRHFFDPTERRFFGYRTTLPRLGNRRNAITSSSSQVRSRQPQLQYHDRGSSLFRLSIYVNNVWIQPLSDLTGRYRESSPTLYREQPALTHRLVPWINRELAALIPAARIAVVLSNIMGLIDRHPIDSREFRQALRPDLGSRTRHFVHEFYNFARSPYDMVGHDNASQYIPRYTQERGSSSNDSDSDVIIEDESSDRLDIASSRIAREETIGNDGSVFISSDTDTSVNEDIEALANIQSCSSRLTSLLSRTRDLFAKITEQSLNEPRPQTSNSLEEPGPSGVSSSSSTSVKREKHRSDNSDPDECLIVDVLKARGDRTPELINLSSNSDTEQAETIDSTPDNSNSRPHFKKKVSKQAEGVQDSLKQQKSRKKPRLDRTSFSLHFSGTLNCQSGTDHNYYNESASPYNQSSNRTESEEDRRHARRPHLSRHQTQSRAENKLSFSIESNSNTDEEIESRLSEKRKTQLAVKYRRRRLASARRVLESPPSGSPPQVTRKRGKQKDKSSAKSSTKSTKKGDSASKSKTRVNSTVSYNFRTSRSKIRKRHRKTYFSSSFSTSSSLSSSSPSNSSSSSQSSESSSSSDSSSSSSSSLSSSSGSFVTKREWKQSVNNANSSESETSSVRIRISRNADLPQKVSHKRKTKQKSNRSPRMIISDSDDNRASSSKTHHSRPKSDTRIAKKKRH